MSPDVSPDKPSLRRRINPESLGVVALLTLAVALGPLATDLYLPSLPAIGRYFAADVAATQLTLSVFLVGFAVSQLVYGALSDRFGRRPVMLAGLVIFLAASALCALASCCGRGPGRRRTPPATRTRRRRSRCACWATSPRCSAIAATWATR